MRLQGSSSTFVNTGGSLSGNQLTVEMKLPGSSSETTGWMDCTKSFATGQHNDGDGCINGVGSLSLGSYTDLTVGTKSTAASSGYVVIRITAPSSWSGSITQIDFSFS
jgi:hypothetical protein